MIKTNQNADNIKNELMAYVFGHTNKDNNTDKELKLFDDEMGQDAKFIYDNILNELAFEKDKKNYSCYNAGSNPTNNKYKCDTIFVALKKEFPEQVRNITMDRIKSFCDYYKKEYNNPIKLLDINYYYTSRLEMWIKHLLNNEYDYRGRRILDEDQDIEL